MREQRNGLLHVFCGPTINRRDVELAAPGAIVHPPIKHGDLYSISASANDTVLIIDGFFHQSAPVRHKEILDLLDRGVRVAGSSSMGALRAAELDQFGMEGIGRVYDLFRRGEVERDDEVAVAHLDDEGDYRALSEPLVNFRVALSTATTNGILTSAQAESLLQTARELPFAARTWKNVQHVLKAANQQSLLECCTQVMNWMADNPVAANAKRADAAAALGELTQSNKSPATLEWTTNAPWLTHFVPIWRNQYETLVTPSSAETTRLTALRFCQLYEPSFPLLWRRLVLAYIAGRGGENMHLAELEAEADAAIQRRGIDFFDLTQRQRDRWLSPQEQQSLDEDAQLRTLLIRSTSLTAVSLDFRRPSAAQLLRLVISCSDEARATLDATSRLTPEHLTPAHLKSLPVEAHLDEGWAIDPSTVATRMAAAVDRGFRSFSEAVDASRSFYLDRVTLPLKPDPLVPLPTTELRSLSHSSSTSSGRDRFEGSSVGGDGAPRRADDQRTR